MKIIVVDGAEKTEFVLDGSSPERITIPTGLYIGLQNVGDEEAWLVNFPIPPYDPLDSTEQLEKTQTEIENQLRGPESRAAEPS